MGRHEMKQHRLIHITEFARIDGAMLKVIKASKALNDAKYSSSERPARDLVIKAADHLRQEFTQIEKEINDEYSRQQQYNFTDPD